ncbi:MAG: AAA family ATPase [Tannerellaceae bacterium]|nr:AAA family ATPase [Tannerellaceae bacterium]
MMNNTFSHYILTGGPGVGKTSLLDGLRQKGFLCVDEVARDIIRNEMVTGGNAVPWGNVQEYTCKCWMRP